MKIDAHQHFWQLDRGDYGWLSPALQPLYRDFMPEDLAPWLEKTGIEGTVLVQAAPTIAETEFLLGLSEQFGFIRGVVGWADFASATAAADIRRLAARPKLVGLRPMIQDIEDPTWMLKAELTPAFEAMITHELTFDALTLPHHLGYLQQLLARHPELRVVIDHASKPAISRGEFSAWAGDMANLARDTAAYCKLSGLVTEAAEDWQVEDLQPYTDHLLATFGPGRLIWGSDWPVCQLRASYHQWFSATCQLLGHHTATHDAIFGDNAVRAYGLAG